MSPTAVEQHCRANKKRHRILLLVFEQARRDKFPELIQNKRQDEKQPGNQSHFNIGSKRFGRGNDHAAAP